MSGLHKALAAITKKTDDLFAIGFDGIDIVFRLPSIKVSQQYAFLLQSCETMVEKIEIYEALFRFVVEDEWLVSHGGEIPAGIPETIGRLVLMLSGLGEDNVEYTEQLFELYRKQVDSTLMYMKRFICQAFPGYTFDTLDSLNYQKIVNIFIQAEKVLLDRGIIEVKHDFKTPEQTKHTSIGDTIRKDSKAYDHYNKPMAEDPRALAYMQQLREQAMEKAKQEERQYKQRLS